MSKNPQIQSTKDYSIFKYVKFNREKTKGHIQEIKNMVLEENLLHLHPILVNEKMEVIDGQHRLEAAKSLGLYIYYIQDEISYQHILNSNLFQKKMSLENVIKFYADKDQLPDYIKFLKTIKDLGLSCKALIGLIFGTVSRTLIDFIKTGRFKFPTDEVRVNHLLSRMREFLEFVDDKRIKPRSMFSSSHFTVAFRNLVSMHAFNNSTFVQKLQNRWFELKPKVDSKEWTKQLIDIYNWKNQAPLTADGL